MVDASKGGNKDKFNIGKWLRRKTNSHQRSLPTSNRLLGGPKGFKKCFLKHVKGE